MMRTEKFALKFLLLAMFLPLFFVVLVTIPLLISQTHIGFKISDISNIISSSAFHGFTTIFLSIILEAIPFILLGTFISSLIQIFVTEETIAKIIPKNKFLGIMCAALLGLVFPVCDCAIVPIVRRLIKKGVPLHIGITFMLAVPILNPVVLSSTYYAFSNNPSMLIIRGSLGFISAMVIGSLISKTTGKKNVLKDKDGLTKNRNLHNNLINYEHDSNCSCGCGGSQHLKRKSNPLRILIEVFEHTSIELHDVGRFIILGSFLSALMQTVIPRKYIIFVGQDKIYSVLMMIAMAFLLAICSETDAFIARTFVGQFTTGSIIAFLIFGPMIDIKNTLMLSGTFKATFVFKLIIIIFIVCFTIGVLANFIVYTGGNTWVNLIRTSLNGL